MLYCEQRIKTDRQEIKGTIYYLDGRTNTLKSASSEVRYTETKATDITLFKGNTEKNIFSLTINGNSYIKPFFIMKYWAFID